MRWLTPGESWRNGRVNVPSHLPNEAMQSTEKVGGVVLMLYRNRDCYQLVIRMRRSVASFLSAECVYVGRAVLG